MRTPEPVAEAVEFPSDDGYRLRGTLWLPADGSVRRPAVVICCATGVAARYYDRFAAWLAQRGLATLTFDYRGIGLSRHAGLRGLRATKFDWGALDADAAIRWLAGRFPERPLVGVGHSIGGFCLGCAPANARLARLLLVGSQYAYWPDYAARQRVGYLLRWHLLMPLLALCMGYFPGRRLGWLEDLPRGVALEWGLRLWPDFDRLYPWLPAARGRPDGAAARAAFAACRADVLACAAADDPYATPAAMQRLLGWFVSARTRQVQFLPQRFGLSRIGHFAPFHSDMQHTLWPLALRWLCGASAGSDAGVRASATAQQ
ncbi:alpha/beta hydrolase family protein [Methyloversatilis thermotolerans]|uniref:alpha/beta hydrolase family protein n=1 Tax=Methyloversatilis thermotolerans TaxID=1346290 RepID=UPI00037BD438|nr:alpha/beta hydrolase [Methyloversatilis thermotolerans]